MNRIFLVSLSTAAVAAALAGCATPQYPVTQGYIAPPPLAPKYSNRLPPTAAAQAEPAPSASRNAAAEADDSPTGAAAAPTPAAVQSTTLAPATAQPSPQPSSPPVVRQEPEHPQPEASVEPRYVAPRVRYLTDGKVISPRGMYRDYVVQKGDHLDAIARDLNTTRRELIEANRLGEPYAIRPGRHLKVPVAKAYVAESGDTLAGVAKRFGVGLGQLSSLNNLSERGRLTPGISIALPVNFEDHGPTRIAAAEQAYVAPRPRASYRTGPAESAPPPGAYVPSKYALAAAAARRAQGEQQAPAPSTARPYTPSRPVETPLNQAETVNSGQGRFAWPVRGQILSNFGATGVGRRNDGVDIAAAAGSEVRAAAAGEVVYAGDQVPGFGNLVLIKHAAGWVSAYAHLQTFSVHMRQTVYQGEPLGTVGTTGGVSEPQLHFEIRFAPTPAEKARPVDPLLVLPK